MIKDSNKNKILSCNGTTIKLYDLYLFSLENIPIYLLCKNI